MCFIKNGDDEIVLYKEGMIFEVQEHYYNDKLIAYNLVMGKQLIESYDEAEIAITAMKEVLNQIFKIKRYIDIEKINLLIEA